MHPGASELDRIKRFPVLRCTESSSFSASSSSPGDGETIREMLSWLPDASCSTKEAQLKEVVVGNNNSSLLVKEEELFLLLLSQKETRKKKNKMRSSELFLFRLIEALIQF